MAKRKPKPVEKDLFGEPIEPRVKARLGSMTLRFEGATIRTTKVGGIVWWAAKDVCRVLGIAKDKQAVYGNPSQGDPGLDDDERGTYTVDTPGGPQEMLCVNESGLYSLIFKSRKPEAKVFRRWVTHEVLPSIHRYGYYHLAEDRIAAECKRLRCDRRTGEVRIKKKVTNRETHRRLRSQKAPVRTECAIYDGLHKGQFGHDAAGLRKQLGVKKHRTPLDHMSGPCLSVNLHAQVLAERFIEDNDVPLSEQPAVFERFARSIAKRDLELLGPGSRVAVRIDHRRGPVLDVVKPLASA